MYVVLKTVRLLIAVATTTLLTNTLHKDHNKQQLLQTQSENHIF